MNPRFRLVALVAALTLTYTISLQAQNSPVFPQKNGITMKYFHYDKNDLLDATYILELRNVTGDMINGGLDLIFHCKDAKGKPYFDDPNEFQMRIDRKHNDTFVTLDKLPKTLKAMPLIMVGDVSSIRVPMTVGETLKDTFIDSTLGKFKASVNIRNKKVLDHKTLTINGINYDCWLVHEEVTTKTPFGTDTDYADTWYAKDAGCIKQVVYDSKGQLKGKLELQSVN